MTADAVLAEAGRLLARRPWLVLPALVVVPLDLFAHTAGVSEVELLVELIVEGAVAGVALALLAGRSIGLVQVLGVAVRRAPLLLVASFVSVLGTALGLVLLVVPGLFVFARWSVYIPVLINERKVGLGLERSWDLVEGHPWVALSATLPPTLVGQFVVWTAFVFKDGWSLASLVMHPILLTYSTVVAVVLYRWLVRVGEEAEEPSLAWGSA